MSRPSRPETVIASRRQLLCRRQRPPVLAQIGHSLESLAESALNDKQKSHSPRISYPFEAYEAKDSRDSLVAAAAGGATLSHNRASLLYSYSEVYHQEAKCQIFVIFARFTSFENSGGFG